MKNRKIVVRRFMDTDGNPAPLICNGDSYDFIGTRYYNDDPVVIAWGHTIGEVLSQLFTTLY